MPAEGALPRDLGCFAACVSDLPGQIGTNPVFVSSNFYVLEQTAVRVIVPSICRWANPVLACP